MSDPLEELEVGARVHKEVQHVEDLTADEAAAKFRRAIKRATGVNPAAEVQRSLSESMKRATGVNPAAEVQRSLSESMKRATGVNPAAEALQRIDETIERATGVNPAAEVQRSLSEMMKRATGVPVYRQIELHLRALLPSMNVGDLLPSTRQLSEQFGVEGVQTIRNAYQPLLDEGWVTVQKSPRRRVVAMVPPVGPEGARNEVADDIRAELDDIDEQLKSLRRAVRRIRERLE